MEMFDLEDWINEFLVFIMKHSSTIFSPSKITEMTHDKEMLAKVKENAIKSKRAQKENTIK